MEQKLSHAVRAVLESVEVGTSILESTRLGAVLAVLEYFVPEVLAEIYPHWKHEGLDGFVLRDAYKLGSRALEFSGLCILISDQTVTPIQVKLRIAEREDKVKWMECRLGSTGAGHGGMQRLPYQQRRQSPCMKPRFPINSVEWVFKAGFGTPDVQPII